MTHEYIAAIREIGDLKAKLAAVSEERDRLRRLARLGLALRKACSSCDDIAVRRAIEEYEAAKGGET